MAKTPPGLQESALKQISDLWAKCEKKFLDALDDSARKRIQVSFAVTLNCSEAAPVIDVKISFKDKCKESGLEVTKTFSTATAEQLDDPHQPALPGLVRSGEPEELAKRGGKRKKRAKADEGEAATAE